MADDGPRHRHVHLLTLDLGCFHSAKNVHKQEVENLRKTSPPHIRNKFWTELFTFFCTQQSRQHPRGLYGVKGAICSCEAVKLNDSERNHTHHLNVINTTCALKKANLSVFLNKRNWGLTLNCPNKIINGSLASFVHLLLPQPIGSEQDLSSSPLISFLAFFLPWQLPTMKRARDQA